MMRNVFLAGLLSAAAISPAMAAAPTKSGMLKIVAIDLEGGGGTLLLTPEGKSILIDTGWPEGAGVTASPDGSQNSGDRILKAAQSLGIKKIDTLIMTHYHVDHVGGIQQVLDRIPVGTVIDHGPNREFPPEGTPPERQRNSTQAGYEKYLAAIKGHKHIVAHPGDVFHFGSLTDTIVASDEDFIRTPLKGAGERNTNCNIPVVDRDGGDENGRSVSSVFRYGKVTIAMFGDMTWNWEHQLFCPIDKVGHINVLIVTQHGTANSSNPSSISAMHPDIAIMGNGGRKGGDEGPVQTITASPGLQGFWRSHESFAHPEISGDKDYIANLNPADLPPQPAPDAPRPAGPRPPAIMDMGYLLEADVTKTGAVTVTNKRNGFSKTYQVTN